MKKNLPLIATILLLALTVLACRIDLSARDQNAINTAAAQTVAALMPTAAEPLPTATPQPGPTATPQPSATPLPCNNANYVSETIPDGSKFSAGEAFTKSWRLENLGTCTWNSNYRLVLQSGERMEGKSPTAFTQNVKPGEKADFILDLKAPAKAGKYTSWWQLQDDQGVKFAQVYLTIEVK